MGIIEAIGVLLIAGAVGLAVIEIISPTPPLDEDEEQL